MNLKALLDCTLHYIKNNRLSDKENYMMLNKLFEILNVISSRQDNDYLDSATNSIGEWVAILDEQEKTQQEGYDPSVL